MFPSAVQCITKKGRYFVSLTTSQQVKLAGLILLGSRPESGSGGAAAAVAGAEEEAAAAAALALLSWAIPTHACGYSG